MSKNTNVTSLNRTVKSAKTVFMSDSQQARRKEIEDKLMSAHLITVGTGGVKTMTTLMLPGDLNIKLTNDVRARLEDFGYIKKMEKGRYHPTRDRTDDVVEILTTQCVRVQSMTKGVQSPFRFGIPDKRTGGVR